MLFSLAPFLGFFGGESAFLLGGLAAVLFVFWSLVVFYGIPGRKASWA